MVDDPSYLFYDKLNAAIRHLAARNNGEEPYIYVNLDGVDRTLVWLKTGFTNSEIRFLLDHPEYLPYTRWYLEGRLIDGEAYLKPFEPRTPSTLSDPFYTD